MAEVVLGALISEFLNVVFHKLSSSDVANWIGGKKLDPKLLEKLKGNLGEARAVLNHAEKKQYEDSDVQGLLSDLIDVVYKADDLLDEVSTKAVTQNKVSNPISGLSNKDIVSMLKDIDERLEPIFKLKHRFDLKDNAVENSSNRSRVEATSLPDDTCRTYGRDKDKEHVIKLLLDDNSDAEQVSVISIVGMGGLGKTTLAQLVYNDHNLKQKFNVRAWVCVSNEFDSVRLTKTIIEDVTEKSCELNDLNSLQRKLQNELNGKKFLVVLDDVWMENDNDDDVWNVFKKSFQSGIRGSKILLTTRNGEVSSITHAVQTHHLAKMSDDDCWLVFADKVHFSSIPSQNVSVLEKIGREIVRKCKGLPLAAQSLGGILKNKHDIRDWDSILNSDIWELSMNKKEKKIIPALRISYHYLPPHLKRCFVYCSLYPKDHVFDKNDLILLWMAEDLLPTSNGGMPLAEVGIECFNNLVSRSFFQCAPRYVLQDITRCKYFVMHDLMHDLATFLGRDFFINSVEHRKETRISDKTRHLSFGKFDDPILENIGKAKFLRSLLPFSKEKVSPIIMPRVILKHKYLRVLSFNSLVQLDALPKSIGKLIHLRYLDLSRTRVSVLPHSLCKLYNLETLKLRSCSKLTMLPSDMQKLENLYHLDIIGTPLKEMPKGISKLIKLQQLPCFIVGKHKDNKIKELGGLSNLHGSLSILNLENLTDINDALEASIMAKKHIDSLNLQWTTQGDRCIDPKTQIDILCKLQPHQDLQSLSINGYRGARFPDWLGNSSYHTLMDLTLSNCKNSSMLASLGQLPSLKHLSISNFNALETIDAYFYKNDDSCHDTPFRFLESLRFDHMGCWKEWSSFDSDAFPKLKSLKLSWCPNLKGSLPNHLPALETLEISYCKQLASLPNHLPALETIQISYCKQLASLPNHLPALETLQISDCEQLASLPNHLPALETLEISDCEQLASLPNRLPALETLQIFACKQLAQLPNHLPALKTLEIGENPLVESVIEAINSSQLTCLQYLQLSNCSSAIPFLGDCLPATLKTLSIIYCRNLEFSKQHKHVLLESLTIRDSCDNLTSLSLETFPNLKYLHIHGCENLESFSMSQSVQYLSSFTIRRCPNLVSFLIEGLSAPNLIRFTIAKCDKLKSSPSQMKALLSKVQYLGIGSFLEMEWFFDMVILPNLISIVIIDCETLLSSIGWPSMDMLTQVMIMGPCHGIKSFPKVDLLPPSLTNLALDNFSNLETLDGNGLHHLTSLQILRITGCPKLGKIEGERLPASVTRFDITSGNSLLLERCRMRDPQIWPKISHIRDDF